MKKKILFIDRDGTIVLEALNYQLDRFEDLIYYPEVFRFLGKIVRKLNFEIIMVTNQDGLGTEVHPEEQFWKIHKHILKSFENEGIVFSKVFIDKTYPHENKATRKPGIGMLTEYINNPAYDLENSFVIGDRLTDVELAKNLNARAIFINLDESLGATEVTSKRHELESYVALQTIKWNEIYTFLKKL